MQLMLSTLLVFLSIGFVSGSHYRGGSISWTIQDNSNNSGQNNSSKVLVRVHQRHSWRRSYYYCNQSSIAAGGIPLIGVGGLTPTGNLSLPSISSLVKCTDFSAEFNYSSGEISTDILLPINRRVEFVYSSCCWINLLPLLETPRWSLRLIIDTNRRSNFKWNNSPMTAMNPIVRLPIGTVHIIRIPMADSDGDPVKCRWGSTNTECGGVCTSKGVLKSDPCELTYNATKLGYEAVALVIEDFDSDNNVLSAIPLQFLIHIVDAVNNSNNLKICTQPPVYIGDRPQGACVGIESNATVSERVQVRIPCLNTSTTLTDILTVSPMGMIKGPITRDSSDPNLYTMQIRWTPRSDQYGLHQLCMTPADSEQQTGDQVCLTFQVDVRPPKFLRGSMIPRGVVTQSQSEWSISINQDIVAPKRTGGVYIRFLKKSNNEEVFRIDVSTNRTVIYQSRQITFYTTGYTWNQGETYYILLDSGVATIDQSCGIESAPITDLQFWTFHVAIEVLTTDQMRVTTNRLSTQQTSVSTLIPRTTTFRPMPTLTTSLTQTTTRSSSSCPRRLSFGSVFNESTSVEQPSYTFCFTVNSLIADVTISANTWVSCEAWKLSGASDPLLQLYSENNPRLLAQNDDGDSIPSNNCYAAVLSYRLVQGDYRVIVQNPKCTYGTFQIRLSNDSHTLEIPRTPLHSCSRRLSFGTVSNITTNVNNSIYSFCFTVNTSSADVTVSANTLIPCTSWKSSGVSDPLIELYSQSNGQFLTKNDDGNHHPLNNCYAAVLSYRLLKGDYQVIIRNPKCAYGTFQLRLSAEI